MEPIEIERGAWIGASHFFDFARLLVFDPMPDLVDIDH
jgi:hypothetical protein